MPDEIIASFISNVTASIIGGIIGAGVGGGLAVALNWHHRCQTAREAFRHLVISSNNYSIIEISPTYKVPVFDVYRKQYPQFLSAYITYRSLLASPYREALDDAWRQYKGTDKKCFESFETDFSPPVDINTSEQYERRIKQLIYILS